MSRVISVLDDNTKAIIMMAWARATGLPDDAFTAPGGDRILATADTDTITVVELMGRTLLHGPQWAIDGARTFSDEGLLEVPGLLALAKNHGPRGTRTATLMYADDYLPASSDDGVRVTDDHQAVTDLLGRCAPDDLDPDELLAAEHRFVLLDEDDDPQAAAAYTPQQQIIADLVMISAIHARGSGALEQVATVAMHDALDAGLIPQLRVGAGESRDRAEALGFQRLGALATVVVTH